VTVEAFEHPSSEAAWEAMWAPYDEATYRAALDQIAADDVVLDIGAGDLRFARRAARVCRRVYAIEIRQELLELPTRDEDDIPVENLIMLHGDARRLPFPRDVKTGILLMRHCTHFRLYADKLKAAGADRLITNARWRMGVEVMALQAERIPYRQLKMGWYACWCGATGFKPGPVEQLTMAVIEEVQEVVDCPKCQTVII
jgi:SAM-dependent methyltransferase